jgi:hypothetical protein
LAENSLKLIALRGLAERQPASRQPDPPQSAASQPDQPVDAELEAVLDVMDALL